MERARAQVRPTPDIYGVEGARSWRGQTTICIALLPLFPKLLKKHGGSVRLISLPCFRISLPCFRDYCHAREFRKSTSPDW
jgi:hypothetical protein